jgi:hypothetical protein
MFSVLIHVVVLGAATTVLALAPRIPTNRPHKPEPAEMSTGGPLS